MLFQVLRPNVYLFSTLNYPLPTRPVFDVVYFDSVFVIQHQMLTETFWPRFVDTFFSDHRIYRSQPASTMKKLSWIFFPLENSIQNFSLCYVSWCVLRWSNKMTAMNIIVCINTKWLVVRCPFNRLTVMVVYIFWQLTTSVTRRRSWECISPPSELSTVPGNMHVKLEVRSFNRFGVTST